MRRDETMKLNLVDHYGYHVFGDQDYHIIRTCITVVSADRTIVSIIEEIQFLDMCSF